MPKVNFTHNIRTKSGKYRGDNTVFMAFKNRTIGITRQHNPNRRVTEQNLLTGAKFLTATRLWKLLNISFKADLNRYVIAYNNQHRSEDRTLLSGYNIFLRACLKHNDPIPSMIALNTIMGNTLAEWIENGFLRTVTVPNPFNALIL